MSVIHHELGKVDARGRIRTTAGWSERGPAWVSEEQIEPTAVFGWAPTGRSGEFMGSALFELTRARV